MIAASICYGVIGCVIGGIFALLFINFDKSWKKILSFLFGIGGSGGLIFVCADYFEITQQRMKFWTTTFLFLSLILSFAGVMILMCVLIKDKDDNDILRIRDILLGQKSYIDKYYEKRAKEIDTRLQIPLLEARERKITQKENDLASKEQYIQDELEKIEELGNKKIRLNLPENRKIIITEKFVKVLPSYIESFAKCINDIKRNTEIFARNRKNAVGINDIITYLLSVSTFIAQDLFGGNSDIRVHFRYYDENTKRFEKLISVVGIQVDSNTMTAIPYENSMIQKSYELKKCLIKSINTNYDYQSNNYNKWKDYMTYTFYNLTRKEMPILTFGISVKNAERYKELFYFLGFVEFDLYLNDYIESINHIVNFENVLYGESEGV